VFTGPDTVCFVMDPTTRAGVVLARHADIDEKTGQLAADEDGGPRRLVISSDFYCVYTSADKKADGLGGLFVGLISGGTSPGPGTRTRTS
jgi:transposase